MAGFSGSDDVREPVSLPLPLVFAVLCLRGHPTIPQTGRVLSYSHERWCLTDPGFHEPSVGLSQHKENFSFLMLI